MLNFAGGEVCSWWRSMNGAVEVFPVLTRFPCSSSPYPCCQLPPMYQWWLASSTYLAMLLSYQRTECEETLTAKIVPAVEPTRGQRQSRGRGRILASPSRDAFLFSMYVHCGPCAAVAFCRTREDGFGVCPGVETSSHPYLPSARTILRRTPAYRH